VERAILLVDMNAFFISCETTRRPELAGRPAAVAGDPKHRSGIILAPNYEARKYGVKTTMVLHQARKLCPDIVLVPPDHGFYERKSREVMQVLSQFTPVVEQNSIDEAWLDATGCEALFGSTLELAQRIMKEIQSKLGLPCSIGIAENKFLAKVAADMKKPMGITMLGREELDEKLWPLPVGRMYGVGKQTALKLNRIGVFTIGQLAASKPELLSDKLGKWGNELHRLANGIDPSPVLPHAIDEMKSIGRSTTLSHDLTDLMLAKKVILALTDEVGSSARKYKKRGRTIQITIKYSDFKTITRQKKIAATFLTKDIYAAGAELLKENWNPKQPIRLLGIAITNFESDEQDQISFFDFSTESGQKKEEKLEAAVDQIREKHGLSMIKPAILLSQEKNPY
jgi:DNA polymerase-4